MWNSNFRCNNSLGKSTPLLSVSVHDGLLTAVIVTTPVYSLAVSLHDKINPWNWLWLCFFWGGGCLKKSCKVTACLKKPCCLHGNQCIREGGKTNIRHPHNLFLWNFRAIGIIYILSRITFSVFMSNYNSVYYLIGVLQNSKPIKSFTWCFSCWAALVIFLILVKT